MKKRPFIETITNSPFLRVAVLSAVLSGVGCFVIWDYSRVNVDFRQLKALLTDTRCQTAGRVKTFFSKFVDETVFINVN